MHTPHQVFLLYFGSVNLFQVGNPLVQYLVQNPIILPFG
jgi:hypothetical protein